MPEWRSALTEDDVRRETFEVVLRALILTLIQRSDRSAHTLGLLRDQALADINGNTAHDDRARELLRARAEGFYQNVAASAGIDFE
jgi:hypothetical protein